MVTFSRFAADESLDLDEVRALIAAGKLSRTALLQRGDGSEWKPASDFPELKLAFEQAPGAPLRPVDERRPYERGPRPRFQMKLTPAEPSHRTGAIRFVGAWFLIVCALISLSSVSKLLVETFSEHWPAAQATADGWSTYQYEVDHQTYQGNHPDGYLRRGQTFTIHYDPAHPARSVTQIGVRSETVMSLFVIMIFIVIGVIAIVWPEALQRRLDAD